MFYKLIVMDIRKYFIVNSEEPKTRINPVFKNSISPDKQNKKIEIRKNKTFKVFTDGSSMNNGYKNCYGGIGVFFEDDSQYNISEKMTFKDDGKVSNNVCELTACLRAIQTIKDFEDFNNLEDCIIVYTDSKYLIDSITKWSDTWQKNGWMRKNRSGKMAPVKNVELIKQIKAQTVISNIRFTHVRAHQKEPTGVSKDSYEYFLWYGNMMADKLANDGAKK